MDSHPIHPLQHPHIPAPPTALNSQPTLLAPRFEDADVNHLMELIADMIERLIAHNDQIPLQTEALTRFHSRSPPSISVLDYLARIVKYANVELIESASQRSCLLITLHYIDQICTRLPKFTITSLTVHRFIIASVTVSSKALCDVFCTNTHYAKVGGIRTNELNMLEREFLAIIDWRLFCTRELLQDYYVNLARTHSKGNFIVAPELPTVAPSPIDEGETDEDTTHAHSVCGTTTEDDGMRSDSDCSDDEEPRTEIVTPRTAAKRRAESQALGDEGDDPSLQRPKGRRRLNDR